MATLAGTPTRAPQDIAERRFFFIMALAMAATIVAGFSLNLAMGRSSFAVPAIYHVHAGVFFTWVAIYVTQNGLISASNTALHKRLGIVAFVWVPLMVVLGFAIMVTSLRRTGGPFFFDQNEFFISNSLQLVLFATLALSGLRARRYSGWHRRLMFCAMTILTGPGVGRLLPMPLLIPNAWRLVVFVPLIFPLIAMVAEKRRTGSIHRAWFWGVGSVIAVQIIADIIAYSTLGVSLTEQMLAGTPGAERPMAAFLPPGFAM
ncbi:MAG: hypothetical protein WC692_05025 [Erythrobacter sp.]|jgi:hypothetical protein